MAAAVNLNQPMLLPVEVEVLPQNVNQQNNDAQPVAINVLRNYAANRQIRDVDTGEGAYALSMRGIKKLAHTLALTTLCTYYPACFLG
jgi:hypothetical protein